MSGKVCIHSNSRTQAKTSSRIKKKWSFEDGLAAACVFALSAAMRNANIGILFSTSDDGLVYFRNGPPKTPSHAFLDHTAGELADVKQVRRCLSPCSRMVEQLDKILAKYDVYLGEARAKDPTISEGGGK